MFYNAIYSTMIRNGKRTYFLDVKESKGKKYAQFSEIHHGDKRTIAKIRIDDAATLRVFATAATEAANAFTPA